MSMAMSCCQMCELCLCWLFAVPETSKTVCEFMCVYGVHIASLSFAVIMYMFSEYKVGMKDGFFH